MTNMTTTDLWRSLEKVLRDKGATDAWIEYALPDLQIAASQFAFDQFGRGHRAACRGESLPNMGPDDRLMVIATETDGSRWLSLDGPTMEMIKAPSPLACSTRPRHGTSCSKQYARTAGDTSAQMDTARTRAKTRMSATIAALTSTTMTDPAEIIAALLEYIAWLETHGSCSLAGGGLGAPVEAAERYVEQHSVG